MKKHGSNGSYLALEMRDGWLKACLHGRIDRSCAVHGNSFDANQAISRFSFDADETNGKWLVLAVWHGFVTGLDLTQIIRPTCH